MRQTVTIGILYSTSGPYAAMGRDCRDGAEFAVAELAADPDLPIELHPVRADPGGDPRAYLEAARRMLRDEGCRQIVGTITSLARKDVIPLVEKHDGLLWYMCPYEGFEANENVVYTGGCPNQHLVPLFDHLIPRHGARAYLVGANYVWGWEMNRIARDLLARAGGDVVGERCLPLEETEVDRLIQDVEQRRPDFVLNNLIGPSSHAFLRAMRDLAARNPDFHPSVRPVVSCDLTECELPEIGDGAAAGHLSAASYFDSLGTPENVAFKARAAGRYGAGRRFSAYFEGAYTAVRILVASIVAAGSDEPSAVRRALTTRSFDTIHGPLTVDPRTNHASLPFHLGRITPDDGFEASASRPAIPADPYLTGARAEGRPALRIVS